MLSGRWVVVILLLSLMFCVLRRNNYVVTTVTYLLTVRSASRADRSLESSLARAVHTLAFRVGMVHGPRHAEVSHIG